MTDVTKRAKDVGADAHINESILSEEILEDQKKNRIDHTKRTQAAQCIISVNVS